MYCPNCGEKIRRGIQFCPNCGAPIMDMSDREPKPKPKPRSRPEPELRPRSKSGHKPRLEPELSEDEEFFEEEDVEEEEIKPRAKKWKWIVAAIIMICIAAGVSGFYVDSRIKDNKYDEDIEEAEKYVEQEDYDKAINIYQNLIIIRPGRERAYLRLAEVYIFQNQTDRALEVLKKGSSKTRSKKIKKQYKEIKKQYKKEKDTGQKIEKVGNGIISSGDSIYADYIKETLIPAYGVSAGGRFSVDFELDERVLYNTQKPPGVFGIHSTLETDLDGDGISELIVVRIASEEIEGSLYPERLYVQIFRKDGDQVIELKQPTRNMRYEIMQLTYSGNLDVFVKEENGKKYLCILNCMRSILHQFNYQMYLDIMQIEGNDIVCRKSAQLEENYIQDTTDIPSEEVYLYRDDNMQKNILYQTDDSHRYGSDKLWYGDLIEPFENCFAEYVTFNQILSIYFESDRSNVYLSGYNDSLPLPFDFGLSEKMKDAVDMFRLRSVWAENEGRQYWDFLDYTKHREGDTQTVRSAYKIIVDEYRGAIYVGDAASNTQFLDVNNLGIALSASFNDGIYYGFYDIDSDGIEELVIGLDIGEEIKVMDIYAYDGSMARKLMYDETMAERSPTRIYEDGTIYKYGSGGALYGGAYFYRLSSQGYAAELYEEYDVDREVYPDSPYFNANEHLTDEQFDSKIAALGSVVSVQWYNIESDDGFTGQAQPPEKPDSTGEAGEDINQSEAGEDPLAALPEDQAENLNAAVSTEEMAKKIVDQYNALLESGNEGCYVIFNEETTETDANYQFMLRYQMFQDETTGESPGENWLEGIVTVNKSDGTVSLSTRPETWNLWED